jgi:protein-S-isoprenylcysteine O-methyltransferase Ste14
VHHARQVGVGLAARNKLTASIVARALVLQNWVAGPAGAASFLPLYVLRMPREERMMLEPFGDRNRAYLGRTDRVVPCTGHGGA